MNSFLNDFRYYIKLVKDLVQKLPLDRAVYAEGSTVSNIAFHAGQSTNNFIRVHVLRGTFAREKEKEYGEQHTLEEILKSLDSAIEACDMLEKAKPDLYEPLANPIELKDAGFTIKDNLGALSHSLSHIAEHHGELNQVLREIEK